MTGNNSEEHSELEPLGEENFIKSTRDDMREISKTSIKKEHYHLISLLEQKQQYYIDAEVTELEDSFQIHYDISRHTIPFEDIKNFSKNEKLRYLLNISKLVELKETRYTFSLSADDLYFTKDGLPLVKTRGLKNVLPPLAISDEKFLTCYKALVINAFNTKTSFNALVEGNLELHKGTPFEKKVIATQSLNELIDFLNEQYDKQQHDYSNNFNYVRKTKYNTFKWMAIIGGIIAITLMAFLAYTYFSIMKTNHQIENGYKSYAKDNYSQVLTDYEDLNAKKLDKEALYIYAKSYIETNKQGLEKAKKENLLKNITPNSNKDYLLYWVELGQGHLDESLNIATYLDDNDIMKLTLINKLNGIKNNPNLSNEKRSEETKKYNEKLQDILDKEKEVKEEQNQNQEKADLEKDEKLKQQEENEKKQKKQEQDDKKKRQEVERKK